MWEILEGETLDRAVLERFKMERNPEASVDGDDRWERDLYEIPDGELPGMWERTDFMEGQY